MHMDPVHALMRRAIAGNDQMHVGTPCRETAALFHEDPNVTTKIRMSRSG